jgi:2,4-dienoyl-CoA reductase-like NADH-dependent reductase (Old Yellow Enzyme family)
MCEYSSTDGFANDWHLVHLGSRAVGGAAVVMTEAAAVEARGRITPHDLGIYQDEHIEMLARINAFLKEQGAVPAIQLAHAGRKASTYRPWSGSGEISLAQGGWQTIAPSPILFA